MKWVAAFLLVLVLAGLWVAALLLPHLQLLDYAKWLTAGVLALALLPLIVPRMVDGWRWLRHARSQPQPRKSVSASQAAGPAELRAAIAEVARAHGRREAQSLPLYLVLGGSGSGRRTLLGGLGFTEVRGKATPLAATGAWQAPSTSVVGWWSSPRALAVVPDGCLDRDRADEASFSLVLDELRRFRPYRTLQGVLIALPLAASAPPATLGDFAARCRALIGAVVDRLGTRVPVYVVLTKADDVAGFTDFWSDLESPEDASWGASFATNDIEARREPQTAVERELEILFQGVHARLFDRVLREPDLMRRTRVLGFPGQLRSAVGWVPGLVAALFDSDGRRKDTARLRGFYFTSVERGGGRAAGRGGQLFVQDLLTSVLLPDRNVATETTQGHQSRTRKQGLVAVVAIGLAAALLGPALASFAHNSHLAVAAAAAGRALRSADPASVPGARGDAIEPLLDVLMRAESDEGAFSVPGWVAPRSSTALGPTLHEAYVRRLDAWMAGPIRDELAHRLDDVATAVSLLDVSPDDSTPSPMQQAYDTVRLAATLAAPSRAKEPWASEHLAALWLSVLGGREAVPRPRIEEHARRYLAELPRLASAGAWASFPPLARARDALHRLRAPGVMELPLHRVLAAAADVRPITDPSLFDGSMLGFLSSQGAHVPGCFTAAGWPKVRGALRGEGIPEAARVERWVVEDASLPASDDELRAGVLQLYFDAYVDAWLRFLDDSGVKTPDDARAAKAELAAFKQGRGFYRTLFDAFKQNAISDDDDPGDAGGIVGSVQATWHSWTAGATSKAPGGLSPVERAFQPVLEFAGTPAGGQAPQGGSSLDKYTKILDDLDVALDAPAAPGGGGPSDAFAVAANGVGLLLEPISEPTKSRLSRLLMPPVRGVATIVISRGSSSLAEQWHNEVYAAWQPLSEEYPFAPGGRPARFSDFKAFLSPDGPLWKFVHDKMANLVEEMGETGYRTKAGAPVAISGAMLACLSTARQISNAYFPSGEDPGLKLSLEADWNAPDVDSVRWVSGGKETALPRGQWTGPVRWFGEDLRLDWVEAGRQQHQSGKHDFALYGLFEHLGGLHPVEGSRTVFTLDSTPLQVKVRWEGRGDAAALRAEFLARLHCPQGW